LEYFPFGETWVSERASTNRTPYLFTGKELDSETGLYYFGARYYDARTSVWGSVDPILDHYLDGKGGMGGVYNSVNLNLFHFAGMNPVKYVDPDGNDHGLTENDVSCGMDGNRACSGDGANGDWIENAINQGNEAIENYITNLKKIDPEKAKGAQFGIALTRLSWTLKGIFGLIGISKWRGTVSNEPSTPSIKQQKQNEHVAGTPQHRNRVRQGEPVSTFPDRKTADKLTQEAWKKGATLNKRENVKEYDFGEPIGTGPEGGTQNKVRVHMDSKGLIHGHPSGPEKK
jgi:RHS repeat-associated protein